MLNKNNFKQNYISPEKFEFYCQTGTEYEGFVIGKGYAWVWYGAVSPLDYAPKDWRLKYKTDTVIRYTAQVLDSTEKCVEKSFSSIKNSNGGGWVELINGTTIWDSRVYDDVSAKFYWGKNSKYRDFYLYGNVKGMKDVLLEPFGKYIKDGKGYQATDMNGTSPWDDHCRERMINGKKDTFEMLSVEYINFLGAGLSKLEVSFPMDAITGFWNNKASTPTSFSISVGASPKGMKLELINATRGIVQFKEKPTSNSLAELFSSLDKIVVNSVGALIKYSYVSGIRDGKDVLKGRLGGGGITAGGSISEYENPLFTSPPMSESDSIFRGIFDTTLPEVEEFFIKKQIPISCLGGDV